MSLTRSLLPMLVLVAATSFASQATGQILDPALPDLCDLEFDWFKPIYCDCPDELEPNSGFFFTYDRMNLYGSRPDGNSSIATIESLNGAADVEGTLAAMTSDTSGFDGSWGNRFNFGFMADEGHGGWQFSVFKLDDPNRQLFESNVDRNGNILDDDLGDPVGPTMITLNRYEMYGIELNRVWRMAPTANGLILEPYIGPRYVRISDYSNRTDVFIEEQSLPATIPVGPATIEHFDSTRIQQLNTTTDNDLFGGQLGIRTGWHSGRWGLTTDVRGYAFKNYADQSLRRSLEGTSVSQIGAYDAAGMLTAITTGTAENIQAERMIGSRDQGNFVYGGELNVQSSFYISTKFAVRAGFDMMAFSDGLGRAQSLDDQQLILIGYNLGFTINR